MVSNEVLDEAMMNSFADVMDPALPRFTPFLHNARR
jgi:hypothetical protein